LKQLVSIVLIPEDKDEVGMGVRVETVVVVGAVGPTVVV
jgi:hypothetical protein